MIESKLAVIAEQDLRRHRRLVDSPCGPRMLVDGRSVLAFASNDYLGFANDQRLIEAAVDGARRWSDRSRLATSFGRSLAGADRLCP